MKLWRDKGKKTCPQCREICTTIKLFFSATEKSNAVQSELDQAKSEIKRLKSEMAKKDEINKSKVKRLKSEMAKKDEINKWVFENNLSNKCGTTILHCWSATFGHIDIYQSAMEKAADKNPKDDFGTTPLHFAAVNGQVDICKLILKNTEEKCPKDKLGWTPLHGSAWKGHTLIYKINMTVSNTDGYTPLHAAAENGHVELFRLIMGEIEDILPKTNGNGKITPLHLATREGHTAVKDLILDYVANSC